MRGCRIRGGGTVFERTVIVMIMLMTRVVMVSTLLLDQRLLLLLRRRSARGVGRGAGGGGGGSGVGERRSFQVLLLLRLYGLPVFSIVRFAFASFFGGLSSGCHRGWRRRSYLLHNARGTNYDDDDTERDCRGRGNQSNLPRSIAEPVGICRN